MVPGGSALSPRAWSALAAEIDDHRVIGLDRELLVGHPDEHLAQAGLFWLLVAGAGDVGVAECLPGPVQVNAESGEGPGRGGIGVGEGGEQQMVRADRLRSGQPGGLAQAGVGGRRGAQLRRLARLGCLAGAGLGAAAQPAAAAGGLGRRHRGQQVDHGRPDLPELGVLLQDLRANAVAFPDHAEQDVLGADVVVMQLQGLAERELEGLLRARGERDMPADRRVPRADDGLDLFAGALERHPEALEGREREPAGLGQEPEQDVLGADVVVLQSPGFLLGKHDDVPGLVSESLKHVTTVQHAVYPVNTMLLIG